MSTGVIVSGSSSLVKGFKNLNSEGMVPPPNVEKLIPKKEGLAGAREAQKEVLKGRAPTGVERVDIPKLDPNGNPLHGQKSHAHVEAKAQGGKKSKSAINQDGTIKHGNGTITEKIRDFLKSYGWNL